MTEEELKVLEFRIRLSSPYLEIGKYEEPDVFNHFDYARMNPEKPNDYCRQADSVEQGLSCLLRIGHQGPHAGWRHGVNEPRAVKLWF